MRPSFNVLDEPWIPVVGLDGIRECLGIRETLRRAHELKEISVVSPLEEFSVYRFLSVFLMDALRPKRLSDIKKIFNCGFFDMERIEDYLFFCDCEGVSFDLFDEKRPFMQAAFSDELDKEAKPISCIDCCLPSGNNHLHFEHEQVENRSIPVDKAARLLITFQQFCTAGAQGYPSGVNASPPYFGIIKAQTLFEILIFTMLPCQTIEISFDDPPVIWRSAEVVVSKKQVGETSWLRGMLFPARRVCLVAPKDGAHVEQVYLSQGENFVNKEIWIDPFVSYRTTENGRSPLRPKREKPVWRNIHDIVDIKGGHASMLLTQYKKLADTSYVRMTLYGVETNQASYLEIMRHDLHFRCDLTEREDVIQLLKNVILVAERLASKLRHCLRDDNIVPENVANDAVNDFYGRCEKIFWKLCESEVTAETIQEHYCMWCETISQYALDAYSMAMTNVNLRGKVLAKAAEQYKWLSVEIKKIKEEVEV